jgi:hypothetical protein
MQNNFATLLNKYLTGKAWLAARPKTKDLSDRFYLACEKPLAEFVEMAPEPQKRTYLSLLRIASSIGTIRVKLRQ